MFFRRLIPLAFLALLLLGFAGLASRSGYRSGWSEGYAQGAAVSRAAEGAEPGTSEASGGPFAARAGGPYRGWGWGWLALPFLFVGGFFKLLLTLLFVGLLLRLLFGRRCFGRFGPGHHRRHPGWHRGWHKGREKGPDPNAPGYDADEPVYKA